jgi:uncharacterized protein YrrD
MDLSFLRQSLWVQYSLLSLVNCYSLTIDCILTHVFKQQYSTEDNSLTYEVSLDNQCGYDTLSYIVFNL